MALVALAAVAVAAVRIWTGIRGGTQGRTTATIASTGTQTGAAATSTVVSTTTTRRVHVRPPGPPYAVGIQSEQIVEPASPSVATGKTSAGAPARILPTQIRYPASGSAGGAERPGAPAAMASGPFPLIVFSQGYYTPVSAYSGLMDAWTRAGYVVAAPTYPLTAPSWPGGPNESDIVNHPNDLRFVISVLMAQANNPQSPLYHLVNVNEIAVAGQSDGGDVSLAVAANTCCMDHAVKAAVIMSGAELSGFGGSYFSGGSTPLLVTQGDEDAVNRPGCSATLYNQAPAPKYFVDLLQDGAQSKQSSLETWREHLQPYVSPGPPRNYVARTSTAFFDYYLKNDRSGLLSLTAAGGVPGVAKITTAPQVSNLGTACP